MGARIAAHFANAGFPVDLLDIMLPDQPKRNAAALAGHRERRETEAGRLLHRRRARRSSRPGNFDDDLERVRALRLDHRSRRRESARSSAGSGQGRRAADARQRSSRRTPAASRWRTITEGFDAEFRRHFLGTHFFNPPRYLHLVEVIPGRRDDAAKSWRGSREFCDLHLGKGVVRCKDTPNFIANRIGCFFGATVHKLTAEGDYTVEEVDALTGPLIGLPKSASFRLIDIVGLDVWVHVLRNLYDLVPHDPARERYTRPGVHGAA